MKKIVAFSLLVLAFGASFGQTEKPIHEIHAAMIYNFLKYIQWPEEAGTDFVVGIIGEDNVYNTLKNYYDGKPKGSKKYSIRKLTDVSEAASCQVVYIGDRKSVV